MKKANEQSCQEEAVNATRRRLLKASAAAPLLASLAPNAALAMSSATQCVGKLSEGEGPFPGFMPGDSDKALTCLVPRYVLDNTDQGSTLPAELYEIDGEVWDADGNSFGFLTVEAVTDLLESYGSPEPFPVLKIFSVSVDGYPTPLGLWPAKGIDYPSQVPLSGSCWASVGSGTLTCSPYN